MTLCRPCIPKLSARALLLRPVPASELIYNDMMEQVMESGRARTQLHLKVLAYHHDRTTRREKLPLELHELKTVLMPRLRRGSGGSRN